MASSVSSTLSSTGAETLAETRVDLARTALDVLAPPDGGLCQCRAALPASHNGNVESGTGAAGRVARERHHAESTAI